MLLYLGPPAQNLSVKSQKLYGVEYHFHICSKIYFLFAKHDLRISKDFNKQTNWSRPTLKTNTYTYIIIYNIRADEQTDKQTDRQTDRHSYKDRHADQLQQPFAAGTCAQGLIIVSIFTYMVDPLKMCVRETIWCVYVCVYVTVRDRVQTLYL